MTSFRQPNAAAVSSEVKDAGVAATMGEAHFINNGAGAYVLELVSAGHATAAELVDWHGDRSAYEFLLVAGPYVITDDGTGAFLIASAGTPFAILVDDGSGGLTFSTDLTATPVAAFYQAANGDIVAARFTDSRIRFAQIGSTISSYQDAA